MLIMGEAVHVWGRNIWEISVLTVQFCCESKIALKKINRIKKRKKGKKEKVNQGSIGGEGEGEGHRLHVRMNRG